MHLGKPYYFEWKGPLPLAHTVCKKEVFHWANDPEWTDLPDVFTCQLPPETWEEFIDGSVRRIHGCGIGCALIKREVLEQFKFRIEMLPTGTPEFHYHDDTYFYLDCWNARPQHEVWIDTSRKIRHEAQDWHEIAKNVRKF